MGSSGEAINRGIDASVGGLVWVRRRNGSWWPGRIMGLDELSESCLVSPRSGTPVKLLGREDASVDWYNLEKSKRVKAFRCGEYDDCIEKAKASAANSSKKAVKYARREDAIIHALEIENARLEKDRKDFSPRLDNLGGENGSLARESPSMSHSGNENDDMDDDVGDSEDTSDSAPELSQSGISFEEPNHNSSPKVQHVQGRRRTPNDSEDDGTEGVKRMRGLEDLGVGTASKRKVQAGGLLELVQQENASIADSNNGNCVSNGSTANGSRGNSSLKRKRTQVANVHEFLKKKNRRRPLTKVLQSTAMVSVPVICDQLPSSCGSPLGGLSDGRVPGLESTESKISVVVNNNSDCNGVSCENGASLNTSEPACDTPHVDKMKENGISSISEIVENDFSDRLFEVPLIREEKHSAGHSPLVVSCSSGRPQNGALRRQSSQSSQAEAVSLRNEGNNETGSTSSEALHAEIGQRIEKGTSKWQLKGKRNSRQISKNRKQDSRKHVDMDDESNACLAGIEHLDGLSQGFNQKFDCNGINGSSGSYNSALEAKCKPVAEDQGDGHGWSKHPSQIESNMSGHTGELKVLHDGSMPPQRLLPYRQSRFTVHSRYRMSDLSIRTGPSDASLYRVELEVKANYRPPHVPLVSLMSKLNGKAIVGHPLAVEVLEDCFCDTLLNTVEHNLEGGRMSYGKRTSVRGRIPTKHLVLQRRRSPNKSPKTKKSGLLPKKIRKLSSLTGNKKSEERRAVVEKPKGPVIACIPLKLVFSRINEAVNGSARQTHRG
ncbi:PWWP domain containing protein [Parasponia andersonii]|uniref:PWWP domain containing protein n=1 Tax=Parasponia andersonii TaxID=3476 RepID=A0A2P5AGS9_PARAD|nr:PWWP domain containing protein [Parasponia andersonii]